MLSYGIGLDIGITSVGWATVALDGNDRPYGIIGMGSRIFDRAEHPKTGASLAAPRREARGARRRLRRHRHRNERIRALILRENLLSEDQLLHLFDGRLSDIYSLRVKALDEAVSREEFARILIHISQRRGFRSNRKGAASKDDGELLSAISANLARMQEQGYRTVAEMYLKDPVYQEHRRNKGGKYVATVNRDMVEDEVRKIFVGQRACGNPVATLMLEEAYLEILLSQRSFDEGPGPGVPGSKRSPYSGRQPVGKCQFEPNEPRAPKASYTFEYFSLLTKVNAIRIVSDGQSRPLTKEQRELLIALAHKTAELNYTKIRNELNLAANERFNMVSYGIKEAADAEKGTKFNYLKAFHQMRKAFERVRKGHFADITINQRNVIADVLTKFSTDANIRPALLDAGLSERDIDAVEELNFSKYGSLSEKAYNKLMPWLEQGMKYSDACTAAGYNFKGHDGLEKTHLLPALDEDTRNTITSPVALRAISQAIKVVNAIIRERGCSPTFINIELAREMSKNFYERETIRRSQERNCKTNELLMTRIRTDYGVISPTGQDLVKLKLYEEQGGICPYSQKPLSVEHLFDPGYAEVDHIIPYSISFDDGYKNKVMVFSKENRDKGNRLPLQYLQGKRREDFIVWVTNSVRDYRKRQRLLKASITEDELKSFKERNIQDTKTASRFLLNYINDRLEFAPFSTGRKKHVTAVNGSVTSYLRKRWGITKIRENGDLHHAVDSLVIACTTDGMIQQVTRYSQFHENRYTFEENSRFLIDPDTGEVIKEFPYPWLDFRQELNARLSSNPELAVRNGGFLLYMLEDIPVRPLFVSRMPRRKVTGAAHKETIKSGKAQQDGLLIVKKSLKELRLDKDGEIAGYYNPSSDRLLYEALKIRLQDAKNDAEKAFKDPFYKPKSDGTQGPLVNKVKVCEPSTLSVSLDGGKCAADNDRLVRIDVFFVEDDGYYFVPIYVADTVKEELPNKACVAKKPYSEWKEMRESDFLFSLYPNDLLKVTHKKTLTLTKSQKDSDLPMKKEVKSEMLYFGGANIASAALTCCNHDNSYEIGGLGIKTLVSLEKYTVDVLGNFHPVKHEIRQKFTRRA